MRLPEAETLSKIEVLSDLEPIVRDLTAVHESKRVLWFPSELLAPPPETELAALTERFTLPGGSWKNIVVDAMFRRNGGLQFGLTRLRRIVERHHVAAGLVGVMLVMRWIGTIMVAGDLHGTRWRGVIGGSAPTFTSSQAPTAPKRLFCVAPFR